MMRNRLIIPLSISVLALAIWGFYSLAHMSSRGGEDSPLYSVRRHDPYGTAALFGLLQKRGVPVGTLERSSPRKTDLGVIVQVLATPPPEEPVSGPPPQLNTQRLKQWILEGNTVIQFTAAQTDLMKACGVPWAADAGTSWLKIEEQMRSGHAPEELPWSQVPAVWDGRQGQSGRAQPAPDRTILLQAPAAMRGVPTGAWRPIALMDDSQAAAGQQRVGAGRLIVVASPSPALNHGLVDAANVDMVLDLVGDGPVLIDEWSHGVGRGGSVVGLIRKLGLMPVVAQAAFAVLLYVWSTLGHRHDEEPAPPRRRSTAEQIVTLGHLYSQVLSPAETGQRVRHEVLRRFAGSLRCRVPELQTRLAGEKPSLRDRVAPILDALPPDAPAADPACARCGYNLRGSGGDACPECGAAVPPATQRHMLAAAAANPTGQTALARGSRVDGQAARLLTLSYNLTTELTLERIKR